MFNFNETAYISFVRPVNFDSTTALLNVVQNLINQGRTNITLMISSSGGGLIPGFAAYNQLLMLPINLTTYNIGSVNSIATIIFLAGKRRIAVPNATFLFHGTTWGFGHSGDIPKRQLIESVSALEIDESRMKSIIVAKTMLTDAAVETLLFEGVTKDAQFAKDCGIIDEIITDSIPQGIPVVQI